MLKTAFIAVLLGVFVARAGEPATISYHTSEVPLDGLYYYVDVDQDGTFDYIPTIPRRCSPNWLHTNSTATTT
jgi:hypothetical protein